VESAMSMATVSGLVMRLPVWSCACLSGHAPAVELIQFGMKQNTAATIDWTPTLNLAA